MENRKFATFPPVNWNGFSPEIRTFFETHFDPKFDLLLRQQLAIFEKLESHHIKKAE